MSQVDLLRLGRLALLSSQVQHVGDAALAPAAPDLFSSLGLPAGRASAPRIITAAGRSPACWRVAVPLERLPVPRGALRRTSTLLTRLGFPAWLGGFCLLPDQSLLLLVDLARAPHGGAPALSGG